MAKSPLKIAATPATEGGGSGSDKNSLASDFRTALGALTEGMEKAAKSFENSVEKSSFENEVKKFNRTIEEWRSLVQGNYGSWMGTLLDNYENLMKVMSAANPMSASAIEKGGSFVPISSRSESSYLTSANAELTMFQDLDAILKRLDDGIATEKLRADDLLKRLASATG